jgi:hypothetical protein
VSFGAEQVIQATLELTVMGADAEGAAVVCAVKRREAGRCNRATLHEIDDVVWIFLALDFQDIRPVILNSR